MKTIRTKWMSGFFIIILLMSLLPLQGCAIMRPRRSLPMDFTGKVTIIGMPDIRTDIDDPDPVVMQQSLVNSFKEENKDDYPANKLGIRTYPVLAVSGAGANGAYGAGVIKGWSKEGSRPLFKIVTGVSSGSIIALYAFLGKEYDDQLEKFFTTNSTKDIMVQKNFLSILFGNSLMGVAPLAKKIAFIVDKKLMAKVAEEHKHGRRLFVGTVNLDAQEFVVWDMGAIACKGGPEALKLFRKVIMASTALPMTFPPVHFKVISDSGKFYDEMHVDGATIRGVFYIDRLTKNMEGAAKLFGIDPSKYRPQIYILSNCLMSPNRQQIKDGLIAISMRSVDTIVASANNGDTYRMYAFAKKRGLDFNLAYIPADFKPHPKDFFDVGEMKRLFKRGYDDAVNGYKWHKTPSGYAEEEEGPEKTE